MVFFFKQKTAYDMRISDWSSDVCSSDLKGCQEFLAGRIALDTDVHHFQDALQGPAHRRIVVDHGNMDSPLAHRRAAHAPPFARGSRTNVHLPALWVGGQQGRLSALRTSSLAGAEGTSRRSATRARPTPLRATTLFLTLARVPHR